MAANVGPLPRRVITVAGVLIAIALGVVVVLVVSLDRSIDRVDVEGLGEQPEVTAPGVVGAGGDGGADDADSDSSQAGSEAPGSNAEAITVLLLGSDSREVLTPDERRELGTGYAGGERTESIALMRLDPEADTLRMLNVPRDTLVTRCDGSRGRVNAAYSIGESEGIGALSCVVQTLSDWADITIDHVVKIDFRGFVDIVDEIGGVPITLDEPIADRRANLDLPAGCTRLDGAEALAFVRARSIDSDFGRIARQQRFMEELRREVAELGILSEPRRSYRTALAMARAVELDGSLTPRRIHRLVRQHRETLRLPIEGRSIPGRTAPSGGIAFLRVEPEDVEAAVDWLHGGSEPSEPGYDAAFGDPGEPVAGTQRPREAGSAEDVDDAGDAIERC